jgi:hypothetical protein
LNFCDIVDLWNFQRSQNGSQGQLLSGDRQSDGAYSLSNSQDVACPGSDLKSAEKVLRLSRGKSEEQVRNK